MARPRRACRSCATTPHQAIAAAPALDVSAGVAEIYAVDVNQRTVAVQVLNTISVALDPIDR
jgi:hypothetical protein